MLIGVCTLCTVAGVGEDESDDAAGGIWEKNFRDNMVRLRQSADMTQNDLARHLREEHGLPFHQTTIQRIESGQRPIRLNEAHVIGQVLGAGVDLMMADFGTEKVVRLHLQAAANALLMRARQISSFVDDQVDALRGYRRDVDRVMKNYRESQNKKKESLDPELVNEVNAFNKVYDSTIAAWDQAASKGRLG